MRSLTSNKTIASSANCFLGSIDLTPQLHQRAYPKIDLEAPLDWLIGAAMDRYVA